MMLLLVLRVVDNPRSTLSMRKRKKNCSPFETISLYKSQKKEKRKIWILQL